MQAYVSLLRGINVGGRNKIAMPALEKSMQRAGFAQVSTYINTGNVFFESSETDHATIVKTIEAAIEKDFGLKIPVIIRTKESMAELGQIIPSSWQNDKEAKTDVLFMWDSLSDSDLQQFEAGVDQLLFHEGCVVWHVARADQTKSGLHKLASSKVYKQVTVRNVNTARAIIETLAM